MLIDDGSIVDEYISTYDVDILSTMLYGGVANNITASLYDLTTPGNVTCNPDLLIVTSLKNAGPGWEDTMLKLRT